VARRQVMAPPLARWGQRTFPVFTGNSVPQTTKFNVWRCQDYTTGGQIATDALNFIGFDR